MNRLKEKYLKEVVPAMKAKFGYQNNMAVPKILKVTVNTGVGKYRQDQKAIEEIERDITAIAGQKAVYTKAKRAISSFKTREGQVVGVKVTLRGKRMYDFLDRLISLSLPRTKDFRGLSPKSVDPYGNLNMGIKEQIVFPEISHENIRTIFSLEVCVSTTAASAKEGFELFKLLGFPVRENNK